MRKLKQRDMVVLFAIFGAFVTIGTSIVQWTEKRNAEAKAEQNKIEAEQNRIKAERKQDELEAANKQIILLQNQTIDSLSSIADLNKKIAELQEELKNKLTGEGSFPFLRIAMIPWPSSNDLYPHVFFGLNFELLNGGKYPINGVKVKVIDIERLFMLQVGVDVASRTRRSTLDDVINFKAETEYNLGALNIGKAYLLHTGMINLEKQPPQELYRYWFNMDWNNGSISYQLILRRKGYTFYIEKLDQLMVNGKESTEAFGKFVSINDQTMATPLK
jgi:hypothetical protein